MQDKARKGTGMQIDALEDGYVDNELFALASIKVCHHKLLYCLEVLGVILVTFVYCGIYIWTLILLILYSLSFLSSLFLYLVFNKGKGCWLGADLLHEESNII